MRHRTQADRPWSPQEVEEGMADVSEAIDDALAALMSLGEEAVERRIEFEVEEAKLILLAIEQPRLTSEALRKAWAMQQLGELKKRYLIADHIAKTQAKVLAGLETQADLLRSAGRSHRDLTDRPGYGTRRD